MGNLPAIVCHPGMQHAPWLVEQLERTGNLAEFWTGIGLAESSWLGQRMRNVEGGWLARVFARRLIRAVPPGKIHLKPTGELIAAIEKRIGREEQLVLHRRNRAFQTALPERLFHPGRVVIGFDTCSWVLAARCAAGGASFVLDQSIGHPVSKQRIYEEVRRRYPALSRGIEVRNVSVLAAERIEHQLAHRIVVASSFTRRTLIENGCAAEKIVVNPYGVDLSQFALKPARSPARPFRFVFVGQITARKGIPLLLETWRRLGLADAELWIVGRIDSRVAHLAQAERGVRWVGPVAHSALSRVLGECDAFVFPTYFEGFGLVLLEAMSCGLPIIASDASAGPDLVTNGQEGFVFAAGDGAALGTHLRFAVEHPAVVEAMGQAARRKAEGFTWNAYGDRWASLVEKLSDACVPRAGVGNTLSVNSLLP